MNGFREAGESDVEEVVFHAALFGGGRGEVLGDVDEDAGFVGADLVDEDGGCVAEDDVAVVGDGELGVDELEVSPWALREGLILRRLDLME